MNEFKIACPSCEQRFLCNESYWGTEFTCPSCGTIIVVSPPPRSPSPGGLRATGAVPAPAAPRETRRHTPQPLHMRSRPRGKSWLTTFFLALLLGGFGLDRFYNGRIGLGIGKLLTGGLCGIWTLIDCILLLLGRYRDAQGNSLQPAQRSHRIIALSACGFIVLANIVAVGLAVREVKSTLAEMASAMDETSASGFDSPEAVFEAMQTATDGESILLVDPEERPLVAFGCLVAAQMASAFQSDADKKQESAQALKNLTQQYNLTNRFNLMSMNDESQVKAMAAQAFADVDLVAFMSDLEAYAQQYSSFPISLTEHFTNAASLEGLETEGDRARATLVSSDGSAEPVVFIRTDDGWFLSITESATNSFEPQITARPGSAARKSAPRATTLTLEELEQNAQIKPEDPTGWYELAAKRVAYGQWDAAIEDLEKAFELNAQEMALDPDQPNLKAQVLGDDRFRWLLRERPKFKELLAEPSE